MNNPVPTTPAPPTEILTPVQRSLPELTDEIQRAHGEVMSALAHGAAAAIRAGHALNAAKTLLRKQRGHGLWQDYIAVECHLGARTAQIYMYLAKHEDKLRQLVAAKPHFNSFLTQGQALKLLSVARKKSRRPATVRAPT